MDIQQVKLFGRDGIKVFVNRPKTIIQILSNRLKEFGQKDAIITYQLLKESFPNASLHKAYGATETTSLAYQDYQW
ncbi:hypothetical protein [Psychrobacillus sp. OK032]|uniref:hypothetical protein n=1 Tax=Psychrobacillus sp. OK032 TaxID=1884358 RepID=UPI0008C38CB5|nr:hypothetical protein [Psychrobacillus sp. OK032]SER67875.1 hypothetical protein SAMN05518872_101599 [Psychrobacillus sp. OK032]